MNIEVISIEKPMETRAGNQLEEVRLQTYRSRRLLNRFSKIGKFIHRQSKLEVDSRTPNRQYDNGNMFLEVLEAFFGVLSELLEGGLGQYSES